ncbi:OmpA family protein [Rhodobacter sp. KR11]|uniref:OmpA family protein n=1 Tax=Rhodobacter sp. KR11 TaxID=2974588 RepID=UPI0022230565|nr:OmpA family protein [Rhodobacter sp. KR11]MCW1917381.1 OmpA family protein [Rhodobacter sp. KR11]
MFMKPALIVSLLALAACTGEVGSEVDEGAFGTPTMVNGMAMMGEGQATELLGTRFNAEVPTAVTFAFNSDVLTPQAQQTLATQATWIRKFPEVKFSVYGHTDLVGSESYNKGLGLRRAKAAVNYLVSQGISRSRLEALVSLGETQPVVATQNREERNRRAVTAVSGFAKGYAGQINGKYAAIIFRDYVESGTRAINPATTTSTQIAPTGQ